MSLILSIDLGKFSSVACVYEHPVGTHRFVTLDTTPQAVHDLIAEHSPDRVVIEVANTAGWVRDLCEVAGVEVQVANPNHEGWRWNKVKRKTDRDDALRLARLSAMDQLPTVHVPVRSVREWRSLIAYRADLVRRRTMIKNNVRAVLDRQGGLAHPAGKDGWTNKALVPLRALAKPMAEVDTHELWRGTLDLELSALDHVEGLIRQVERRLDLLAAADERVDRLRSVPGIGPRLSELVVAVIDRPERFRKAKQVAAYAGLVPRQFQSGTMNRSGRITGRGNPLLRALLVEIGWLSLRYNPLMRAAYERICQGSRSRRKIAIVAVARKLLTICWAMLRDGTRWLQKPPASAVPA